MLQMQACPSSVIAATRTRAPDPAEAGCPSHPEWESENAGVRAAASGSCTRLGEGEQEHVQVHAVHGAVAMMPIVASVCRAPSPSHGPSAIEAVRGDEARRAASEAKRAEREAKRSRPTEATQARSPAEHTAAAVPSRAADARSAVPRKAYPLCREVRKPWCMASLARWARCSARHFA